MKETLTSVTRKGQITVPVEIRRALGLKEGDKVALSLVDRAKGQVRLRAVRTVAELTYGAVAPRKHPEDFEDLRRQFEEGQAEAAESEASSPEKP